jgi:hypothetical protein
LYVGQSEQGLHQSVDHVLYEAKKREQCAPSFFILLNEFRLTLP